MVFGDKILPDDARPEVVDSAVMMSLKHLFEAADGAVYWFPDQRLARAITADADLAVQVGSTRATLNGKQLQLGASPVSLGGRLLVPVTLLEKALGVTVLIEPASKQVTVKR